MGSVITLIQRMLSGVLNAIRTTTIQEELFVIGKAFSFEEYFSFGTDEVKTFIFDPTAFEGSQIIFNPIAFSASSGPVLIDFYTGTTSDGDGDVQQSSNRREGMPNAVSILTEGDSNITLGDRFAGDAVPSTGLGVGNTNGAANQPGLPFEIDITKKHAFTVENTDGSDVIITIKMTWFEV